MEISRIEVLGSGSSGNCYLIYDSKGECLILDVGLNFKNSILPHIDDFSKISAILVSHDHVNDHTLSLDKCIKMGIDCYGNADICSKHKGCKLIEPKKKYNLGGFKIQTFELVHNVPNNAFVIDTIDDIRILYCTDTQYIPKVVKNVNYALVEANNDEDIMIEKIINDDYSMSHSEYHQNLDDCIDYLKRIYSPKLMGIVLIHLSDHNSNARQFIEKVQNELGFGNVCCAEPNLIVELNKDEF